MGTPRTRSMSAPSTNQKQLETLAVTAKRDRRARAEIVEACVARIDRMARRHRGAGGVDYDELMEAGVAGLLRAIERYDATLGTPFWSYAAWWVRQAMHQVAGELAAGRTGYARSRHWREAS
jgi:RNA polymerase sigma factor (sigma-70 family)